MSYKSEVFAKLRAFRLQVSDDALIDSMAVHLRTWEYINRLFYFKPEIADPIFEALMQPSVTRDLIVSIDIAIEYIETVRF